MLYYGMVKIKSGKVRQWHRPNNADCPQNIKMEWDCDCKRPPRNRKPYRVCRVHDSDVPHGTKADIILEIHPNGRLIFREKARPRRFSYATTVGKIYTRLLWNEAMTKAAAKAKARKDRKLARKKARK